MLCFDGDSAGQKAAQKSLPVLLASSLAPKILQFEDAKWDPDSFIRSKGKEKFKQKIKKAPDLFLKMLSDMLGNLMDVNSRLLQIPKITALLAPIKKPELRNYYMERVADTFGVADKWAKSALQKELKKRPFSQTKLYGDGLFI